jgi:hypothetical protein
MKELNINNFNIILEFANKYFPPRYNTKYSNEYYLKHIIYVLKDVVSWKSLQIVFNNKSYNHYKTLSKIHLKWSRKNVYIDAFNKIKELNINCQITNNLYIDGTLIINKNGIDKKGYGCGESRKKQFSSVTLVCNENLKPVCFFSNEVNIKIIKCNNEIQINTLAHDSKAIEKAIHNINSTKKYYLIGDSGYLINEKRKLELPANVTLIAPKRKNQLIRTTPEEKEKLKKRYKVEKFRNTM